MFITQLYEIKNKIDKGWVEILSLRAALIVYSLNEDFALKYEAESLLFTIYAKQDILIKANEKLLIVIDLWLDFLRPFMMTNPFETNDTLCCFYEVLRYKSMTSVERLDFINPEARDVKIDKGQVLLSFQTVGLNGVEVYLVKESAEALRNRWLQDTTKARVECSRQLVQRLSSSILPLLKKKQHVNLDLRNESFSNNLVLARVNNELSCLSHQLLDEKKITFSNKILLLNFLRQNFGIN